MIQDPVSGSSTDWYNSLGTRLVFLFELRDKDVKVFF